MQFELGVKMLFVIFIQLTILLFHKQYNYLHIIKKKK